MSHATFPQFRVTTTSVRTDYHKLPLSLAKSLSLANGSYTNAVIGELMMVKRPRSKHENIILGAPDVVGGTQKRLPPLGKGGVTYQENNRNPGKTPYDRIERKWV